MRWELPVPLQASRELVGVGGLGQKVLTDYGGIQLLDLVIIELKSHMTCYIYTVYPHIVSALEYFPPLNCFLTFM